MLCTFLRQIFPKNNQESPNGWYIAEYTCDESRNTCALAVDENGEDLNGKRFRMSGTLVPRHAACQYNVDGQWVMSNKGQRSLQASSVEERIKMDRESIVKYLQSLLKGAGVGPVIAGDMFSMYGKDIIEIIDKADTERLIKVSRISEKVAEKIIVKAQEEKNIREIAMAIAHFNLPMSMAKKLNDIYGNRAVHVINNEPYSICRKVDGFTFTICDRIAIQNNIPVDSPQRINAAFTEVLYQAENGGPLFSNLSDTTGHLCMEFYTLLNYTNRLLNQIEGPKAPMDRLQYELFEAIKHNRLARKIDTESGRWFIYRKKTANAETKLAINIIRLARQASESIQNVEEEIRIKENDVGWALAPEQKQAVVKGLKHNFVVITGGPGTGKTTILSFIRDIYMKKFPEKTILLCSPTGVAATRMSASTGAEASTAHNALGLYPDSKEEDVAELCYDFVVADEVSMFDVYLASIFMNAIKKGAKALFIGDVDQLPSVGPGAVLRDIIASGVVEVARLTKVYRQKGDNNMIPTNAQRIKDGRYVLDYDKDSFQFVYAETFEQSAEVMRNLYLKEVAARGIANTMMLSPYRKKTASGSDALNAVIRDIVNPPALDKPEVLTLGGKKLFRLGDRVMNMKNVMKENLFRKRTSAKNDGGIEEMIANGDIGVISKLEKKVVVSEDKSKVTYVATIDFGHQRVVEFDENEMGKQLEWAYAMTVHKSQGSEADVVIFNLLEGHGPMLLRNLIYTAITRAKKKVYLVGTKEAIKIAVGRDMEVVQRRNTMLAQELRYISKLSEDRLTQLIHRFCKTV